MTLAGTRRILEAGRKLLGAGRTGDEGTSRVAHTWTVDPDRIRQLDTGQAAYIQRGGATFVHVAPAVIPRHRRAFPAPGPRQRPTRRAVPPTRPMPVLPPAGTTPPGTRRR